MAAYLEKAKGLMKTIPKVLTDVILRSKNVNTNADFLAKIYDYVKYEIHYFIVAQAHTIDYCPLKALDN